MVARLHKTPNQLISYISPTSEDSFRCPEVVEGPDCEVAYLVASLVHESSAGHGTSGDIWRQVAVETTSVCVILGTKSCDKILPLPYAAVTAAYR